MIGDITVGGLAFTGIVSDLSGSIHREVSRGAALPTEFLIKHQKYVDSVTKKAGVRTLVRFDHHMTMTDGLIQPVSYYSVLARPDDPLVTAGIIEGLQALLTNLLHGTTNTNGLDLQNEVLVLRTQ